MPKDTTSHTTPVTSSEERTIMDGMNLFERFIRRGSDCIVAAIGLVVFSPLILICYIAIRLEDGKPAIYKQERIGRYGLPFYIYKFRSMHMHAESPVQPQLYHPERDKDLTRVGRFLRNHHLDELPQLWNVLIGDMALVGPRPERRYYVEQIIKRDPRYKYLYQIRPGVTSYATLYNGYTDTMEKMITRLQFDLYYLEHRSWCTDISILWKTFIYIISGKVF